MFNFISYGTLGSAFGATVGGVWICLFCTIPRVPCPDLGGVPCRYYQYCNCATVPLLVQRCNGTTAGLGYLEESVICPCKSPHWTLISVRTVDPQWGEWFNSSADFNPNNNHVNTGPKQASFQTTSRPHHHATLKQKNYCMQNCTRFDTNLWNKTKKSGTGHQNNFTVVQW
jgi:hypothetical protein